MNGLESGDSERADDGSQVSQEEAGTVGDEAEDWNSST